ncbi:MAG: PH domain-containing protein [Candidatus Bathyarchaeia archaeon]
MDAEKRLPPQVSLLQNEKVIMPLRRRYTSILTSILSFIATAFLVSLSSTIRYITQQSRFGAISTIIIYIIIIGFVFAFGFMALVGYFYVQGHLYILTNRRIILYRKFITISVREIAYPEITDLIMNQGPIARILNYGSIAPLSPGVRGFYAMPYPYTRRFAYARVELKDVDKPLKVMDDLFRLIRTCKSKSE